MKNSLTTIQKLAKFARVLCRIAFVFSLIGAIGCLIGIICLGAGWYGSIQLGNITLHSIIEKSTEMSIGSMYASMAVGFILSLGEVFLSKLSENYFRHELAAGTPFTLEGAAELKKLGILTICIPIVAMALAGISYTVINSHFENVMDMHIDSYASVGLGIAFLIVSLLCRYGAELKQKADSTENTIQTATEE